MEVLTIQFLAYIKGKFIQYKCSETKKILDTLLVLIQETDENVFQGKSDKLQKRQHKFS